MAEVAFVLRPSESEREQTPASQVIYVNLVVVVAVVEAARLEALNVKGEILL